MQKNLTCFLAIGQVLRRFSDSVQAVLDEVVSKRYGRPKVRRLHLMKAFGYVFVAGLFIALLAAVVAPLTGAAHPPMDIVASNWKFTPDTITVPVNEPTTLRLTSSEGVHGLKSEELGIADTMIMPDKFVTVTFTPKKAGTYVVHCSQVCGAGHPNMTLTIKVEK
jgi:cytochrome c oxidase subunit 2